MTEADHEALMRVALDEARKAGALGEVPVGALLVGADGLRAAAFNQPIRAQDPTAHAEILALREAARMASNYRLTGTTLYVTLEPCLMCVGALVNARVATVVFGALEPKFGALRSLVSFEDLAVNHRFEIVAGVLAEECAALVQGFFRERRDRG